MYEHLNFSPQMIFKPECNKTRKFKFLSATEIVNRNIDIYFPKLLENKNFKSFNEKAIKNSEQKYRYLLSKQARREEI